MMDARLLMIAGIAPGAGKSSLARHLAECFSSRGVDVLEVDEDSVWGRRQTGRGPIDRSSVWPEFVDLLPGPERESWPTSEEFVRAFCRVRQRRLAGVGAWIQDWSWLDLAGTAPWATTDESSLVEFSRRLRLEADSLKPAVLYLVGEPEVFLKRAVAERGHLWLSRHARELARWEGLSALRGVAEAYAELDGERRRVLEVGGWCPAYVVADDADVQTVLDRALTALGVEL